MDQLDITRELSDLHIPQVKLDNLTENHIFIQFFIMLKIILCAYHFSIH